MCRLLQNRIRPSKQTKPTRRGSASQEEILQKERKKNGLLLSVLREPRPPRCSSFSAGPSHTVINIYPYMSSSSSPPPCGLLESADGSAGADSPAAGDGEGEGAARVVPAGTSAAAGVAESLLVWAGAGAGTGAAPGGAGAGVGAGAWKAGMLPPISLRRKFAASASFLSHAKYACSPRRESNHSGPIQQSAANVCSRHRCRDFMSSTTRIN